MRSELKLTKYSPNMRDPRVRKRVKKVLDYCEGMLRHDVSRDIHSKKLRELFGNYSNAATSPNNLARWLFANLMRQEPFPYFVGDLSRSYVIHGEGYAKVKRLFDEAA